MQDFCKKSSIWMILEEKKNNMTALYFHRFPQQNITGLPGDLILSLQILLIYLWKKN